jgi:hypothetical protein
LSPQRYSERYDIANKILDVRSKLSAAGLDRDQVNTFVAALEADRTGQKLSSVLGALTTRPAEDASTSEHPILQTTAAMGARFEARLNVLNAEIERVLLDIEMVTGQNFADSGADPTRYDPDHVRKMHRAWRRYRTSAACSAAEDYAGGSMAGAFYLFEEVRISEAFLRDISERLKQLNAC